MQTGGGGGHFTPPVARNSRKTSPSQKARVVIFVWVWVCVCVCVCVFEKKSLWVGTKRTSRRKKRGHHFFVRRACFGQYFFFFLKTDTPTSTFEF